MNTNLRHDFIDYCISRALDMPNSTEGARTELAAMQARIEELEKERDTLRHELAKIEFETDQDRAA